MIRSALMCAVLLLPALWVVSITAPAVADGCYICTRGSACGQYCRYAGRDNWDKRKKCIAAGCRIGGTASCPRAANVRVCSGIGLLPAPLRQVAENTTRPGFSVPWPRKPGDRDTGRICIPR